MSKKKHYENITIPLEEILRIERAVRREEWIADGAYNTCRRQIYTDRKKKKDKQHCREKIRWEE